MTSGRSTTSEETDMHVQVTRGRTSDPGALRAAMDRWAAEVAPGATGCLGATAGVTADGRFVALTRFESADAARRSSEAPEQVAWWTATSRLLDGDVTTVGSDDVDVDLAGDPAQAGFVQVMQGRTTDRQRAKELMAGDSPEWASFRPDILGGVNVDHGDGGWTSAMYFTSEAEAREGERKEPPPAIQAQMAEMNALADGPVEFLDLTDPWMYGPR
jgi:hypothetical protein